MKKAWKGCQLLISMKCDISLKRKNCWVKVTRKSWVQLFWKRSIKIMCLSLKLSCYHWWFGRNRLPFKYQFSRNLCFLSDSEYKPITCLDWFWLSFGQPVGIKNLWAGNLLTLRICQIWLHSLEEEELISVVLTYLVLLPNLAAYCCILCSK